MAGGLQPAAHVCRTQAAHGQVALRGDTWLNSDENRPILQGAGGHYIIGEKMRIGRNGTPVEAFARGGRCRTMPNGLQCKEAIGGGDIEAWRRFVAVRNPVEAVWDRKKREDIVAGVEKAFGGTGATIRGAPQESRLRAAEP